MDKELVSKITELVVDVDCEAAINHLMMAIISINSQSTSDDQSVEWLKARLDHYFYVYRPVINTKKKEFKDG